MATEPDPYRTLGLPRTASLAEVKAAYRRLAKANHPDAAGEAALPRFLAIQAAYERLAGPIPGGPRPSSSTPAPPRKPWEADPDRSDATRRAYGGRARRPAGSTTGKSGGRPKASGTSGGAASGSGAAGAAGGAAGAANAKDPKKATLGSTSYDGVDRDAFEPDWVGGSWYGTTSGTYWTINPKEYADPRKHGPEYQARARRAAQAGKEPAAGVEAGAAAAAGGPSGDEPASSGASASADGPATGPDGPAARPTGPDATPRHTTSSWWDATSGPATPDEPAAPPPRSAPRPRPTATPRPAPGPTTSSRADGAGLSAIGRALTQGAPPSLGWRIARAAIGGVPIALAIGWAVGEVSGCARYAVSCGDTTEPATWLVQALVFLVLLALPVVAGWAVIAAIVSLVVAVPATLFVTASAGAEASRLGTGFLGVVLALAWVGGIVGAIALSRRRPFGPTGPVS